MNAKAWEISFPFHFLPSLFPFLFLSHIIISMMPWEKEQGKQAKKMVAKEKKYKKM